MTFFGERGQQGTEIDQLTENLVRQPAEPFALHPEVLPVADPAQRPALPAVFRHIVKTEHMRRSIAPIQGPNEFGVFPSAPGRSIPPVIADANVLSRDVLRACKQSQHTVLVNTVNSGMLRLYCARHVVDEMEEYADSWADDWGVPREHFRDRWATRYLPLIRVVPVERGLLSREEQDRIDLLDHGPAAMCDPDDVPSATLALQLGGFFLSRDSKPLRAVYGPGADLSRHRDWLTALQCGGDAAMTIQVSQVAVKVPVAMVGLAAEGLNWLWDHVHPLVAVGLLGLAGFGLSRVSSDTRRKALNGAGRLLDDIWQIAAWYESTKATFLGLAPDIPTWQALARELPPEAVLTRAIMHTLARSPRSDRSAAELASRLPELSVPQGEAKVRAALRQHNCFDLAYRGRWQLGAPA